MLIKRRTPQFTGFVANIYRNEHVMITNLYKLIHVSCMTAIFINAFFDPFAHA